MLRTTKPESSEAERGTFPLGRSEARNPREDFRSHTRILRRKSLPPSEETRTQSGNEVYGLAAESSAEIGVAEPQRTQTFFPVGKIVEALRGERRNIEAPRRIRSSEERLGEMVRRNAAATSPPAVTSLQRTEPTKRSEKFKSKPKGANR